MAELKTLFVSFLSSPFEGFDFSQSNKRYCQETLLPCALVKKNAHRYSHVIRKIKRFLEHERVKVVNCNTKFAYCLVVQNSPDHFEGYLLKDVAEFEGWIAYVMPKIASVEKIALHSIFFP